MTDSRREPKCGRAAVELFPDAAMPFQRVWRTARPRFNWSAYGVEHDPIGESARGDHAGMLNLGAAGLARPNVVAAEGCSMNVRRSRFLIPVLVLMLSAMALAACGESDGPDIPDTTAASVIAYLDEVDYQESWDLWPGLGEKIEGGEPHGMLLTTYLNPVALKAFNDKAGAMPDGAIIVKENYTPDGTLAANTVMYKKSGYNPDHNDWFWLKVLAGGTVEKQGMVEGCQNCHGEVRDNDYVWTELLK